MVSDKKECFWFLDALQSVGLKQRYSRMLCLEDKFGLSETEAIEIFFEWDKAIYMKIREEM